MTLGTLRAVAAGLVLAGWGRPAAGAAVPDFEILVPGCENFDVSRVGHHLTIELEASDGLTLPPKVRVVIACEPEYLRVSIEPGPEGQRRQRVVPAPSPDDPERERIAALVVTALFQEPVLPPTSAEPEITDDDAADRILTSADVVRLAETYRSRRARPETSARRRRDRPARDRRRHRPSVARWGGTGGFDMPLGEPVWMGFGGLRLSGWFRQSSLGLWTIGEARFAAVRRTLGRVHVLEALLGTGFSFKLGKGGPWASELDLGAGALYQRLEGRSSNPDVERDFAHGLVVEALAAATMVFCTRRRVSFGLTLRGGYVVGGPKGGVSEEESVSLSGLRFGLSLRLQSVARYGPCSGFSGGRLQ